MHLLWSAVALVGLLVVSTSQVADAKKTRVRNLFTRKNKGLEHDAAKDAAFLKEALVDEDAEYWDRMLQVSATSVPTISTPTVPAPVPTNPPPTFPAPVPTNPVPVPTNPVPVPTNPPPTFPAPVPTNPVPVPTNPVPVPTNPPPTNPPPTNPPPTNPPPTNPPPTNPPPTNPPPAPTSSFSFIRRTRRQREVRKRNDSDAV